MAKVEHIEKITVRLKDICGIWTKPLGAQPKRLKENESSQKQNKWQNKAIAKFYDDYVMPYASSINNNQLSVIDKILDLFDSDENAQKAGSVVSDDPDTSERFKNGSNRTLLEHSLSVAKMAHDFHRKSLDPHLTMGTMIIVALSHDVGKLPALRKKHGHVIKSHVYISGMWIKENVVGVKDEGRILEAVSHHHSSQTEIKKRCDPNNVFLPILLQSNLNDRESELSKKGSLAQKTEAYEVAKESQSTPLLGGAGLSNKTNKKTESKGTLPSEKRKETVPVFFDNSDEVKETAFIKWFNEKKFIKAVQPNISSDGLDSFYHDEYVFVSVKTSHRIVNELRIERELYPFNETSDTREFLKGYLQRIKNVQCQVRFERKTPRKPYKNYYYMIDAGHFDKSKPIDTKPIHDNIGHTVSSIKILKDCTVVEGNKVP